MDACFGFSSSSRAPRLGSAARCCAALLVWWWSLRLRYSLEYVRLLPIRLCSTTTIAVWSGLVGSGWRAFFFLLKSGRRLDLGSASLPAPVSFCLGASRCSNFYGTQAAGWIRPARPVPGVYSGLVESNFGAARLGGDILVDRL